MQTLLAYDGPELVPVNISSAAAALSDVLRDELNDNNCEAFELPSEFTLDATKAFVDYLEAQASHDQFTISRVSTTPQLIALFTIDACYCSLGRLDCAAPPRVSTCRPRLCWCAVLGGNVRSDSIRANITTGPRRRSRERTRSSKRGGHPGNAYRQ